MTKTLTCPSCQKSLQQFSDDSLMITCPACRSMVNLGLMDVTKGLGKSLPKSDLSLGLIGRIADQRWQIVGRAFYEGTVSERDAEDGIFYTENWNVVAWFLHGEDGRFASIEEDAEGYTFLTELPVVPVQKISNDQIKVGQDNRRVDEYGTFTLVGLEGEFSWVPKIGEKSEYYTFWKDLEKQTVEFRKLPNSNEVKEIEFSKHMPLERPVLLTLFGLQEVLDQEKAQEQEIKWWSAIYFIAGICLLFLSLITFASGRKIVYETFNTVDVPADGKLLGPYNFDAEGRVYHVQLTIDNLPKDTWLGGGLTLLDADEMPVRMQEKEFWRETGYDDGYWDESDREMSSFFRLSEAGQYYIEVDFDNESTVKSANAMLVVDERIWMTRYVLLGALLLIGFGFVVLYYRSANPFMLIVGLGTLIYFAIREYADDD